MNTIRTTVLLAGLTAFFLAIGFMLGGESGLVIALVVALGMNAFAYWNSDQMVLSMHGARVADDGSAPEFAGMVHRLADQAGLPRPRVYLIETDQPNAFATGRDPEHGAVAATTGLLKQLTKDEIEGVMAHELAHIKNRDTLIMTIAATISGAISMLANFALFFGNNRNNPLGIVGTILVMILAPIGAMLIQMAISRTREYGADKVGAEICGKPLALASALDRISKGTARHRNPVAEESPATAHLFIANPLRGGGLADLFSTHPPMEERVRRLTNMAGQMPAGSRARRSGSVRRAPRQGISGVPQSGAPERPRKPNGPWG